MSIRDNIYSKHSNTFSLTKLENEISKILKNENLFLKKN
jgi:hypothetical protein